MSIQSRKEAGVTIVTLFGTLEGSRSLQFNDYIDRVFENHPQRVVIDLSQIDYMASTGLALLVSVFKRSLNQKISLVFASPPEGVREALAITRLDSYLPIFENVGAAVTQS